MQQALEMTEKLGDFNGQKKVSMVSKEHEIFGNKGSAWNGKYFINRVLFL